MGDAININAARGNVGGNQRAGGQYVGALPLANLPVVIHIRQPIGAGGAGVQTGAGGRGGARALVRRRHRADIPRSSGVLQRAGGRQFLPQNCQRFSNKFILPIQWSNK